MQIFVSNIPYETVEQDLEGLFSDYGQVQSVKIIRDRETNRSRGFGFVDMDDNEAQNAIDNLDGYSMGGRPLKVQKSKPRERRDRRY